MTRLCTICARGGSKGVPGKNTRMLLGKPLIAHSIEQARASGLFAAIAVSSDSQAILDIATAWQVDYPVIRPGELATDRAAKLPAIRHCVLAAERASGARFDTIVDLDATAPLRTVEDIHGAVVLLEQNDGAGNVITGTPSRRSPYFNLVELTDTGTVTLSKRLATPVVRRQDAPVCYDMNASIYVWKREALFACDSVINDATRLYVMPESRSVDLDSAHDFEVIEFLMTRATRGPEAAS